MSTPSSSPSPCSTKLNPPYVVVGNEHALYRDVLSSTVMTLRPEMSVYSVSPAELDSVVQCLQPILVICSYLSVVVEQRAGAWILLHPDVEQPTIVSLGGVRRSIPHPPLDELLELIDELLDTVAPTTNGLTA